MKENSIKNAIQFYVLATTLKDKIRTGWINWNVSKERLESIAEHIYGTCILAIGIDSEFDMDINLNKVIKMLVLHELEEVIIGDLTPYDTITKEEKLELGKQAVSKVLENLIKKEEYEKLLNEFNANETPEAKFAFCCDKLEADLQAKIYTENNYCDIFDPRNKTYLEKDWNKEAVEKGATTLYELFINYDIKYFEDIFKEIVTYTNNNQITSALIKIKNNQ